ncbi:hypothetical protein DMH04_34090 [Kibdelosporangium aridum]|uniref:Uncharacterized protein n=1 Tax=Kibdelosporangium aridum TaxID=2030 RepID=A0A428Z110_KIBAR|nr:hypothetical protein [Kibdelosporangium aridum]RSM78189.1 hypothetical protein DMH04_34090 [Kibdelosporangium aridum]
MGKVAMLTDEQAKRIREACDSMSPGRVAALALAAVHRILPVYQVYSEVHPALRGHVPTHDAIIAAWRFLRRQPGATAELAARRISAAKTAANRDLARVEAGDVDLPESLVSATILAVMSAFDAFVGESRTAAYDAVLAALDVDVIWAEGVGDMDPTSEGIVQWANMVAQYRMQSQDIDDLSVRSESEEIEALDTVYFRAESEGLAYLTRMSELLGQ